MHPGIVCDAPGACPIRGMALEPMVPTDEPSHEQQDFARRTWMSAAMAIPLLILPRSEWVAPPMRDRIGRRIAVQAEFVPRRCGAALEVAGR